MAELKFENEAGTSQSVATDLKGLSEQVGQAIDAAIHTAVENKSGGSAGPQAQSFGPYDEALSILAGSGSRFGKAASLVSSVHAEMNGPKHSSFFPVGATQTATKSNPNPRSRFMPSTYGERVQAAKKPVGPKKKHGTHNDLVARAGIASQSLTGQSGAHGKASLIKGLKSNLQAAALLGLIPDYLKSMQDNLHRAQTGPMSKQRLLSGLANGNADAENQLDHMDAAHKKELASSASATAPKLQTIH